jgi:hypothetical protein
MTKGRETSTVLESTADETSSPDPKPEPAFQRAKPGEINYWPGLDEMAKDVNDAVVKAFKKHAAPELHDLRAKDRDLYLAVWQSREHGLRFVYVKPGQKRRRPWWAFLFFWMRWD